MKKTALFLLTVILITTMFIGCESGNENPNVSWDIPSNETMENNVSIDFDTEEIIDVESKETTGEVTEPSDTTAEEDTSKQEDTTTPDTVTTPPETTTPNIVTTPPETSAPETNPPVTTAPQPTTPPTSSTPSGFAVKAKKYTFEGNNLLLLDTENKTGNNYTVSVMVTYYDESGKSLKKETETFEGYAAGYQKYFLFNPGITFDSYTYKVLVEEHSGECLASYIDIEFQTYITTAWPGGALYGCAKTLFYNSYGHQLDVYLERIVFDNLGQIKFIPKEEYVYYGQSPICTKDLKVTDALEQLPKEWANGCSIIYVINDIKKPD